MVDSTLFIDSPAVLLRSIWRTRAVERYQTLTMGAATPIKAAPVQPSRELAHVRYFIDGSVDEGVCDRVSLNIIVPED
jgi:hypothetical protein